MILVLLIVILVISLWKWWTYKCFSMGLIYFAAKKYNWHIEQEEAKEIIEYSMKRNIEDLFKKKED